MNIQLREGLSQNIESIGNEIGFCTDQLNLADRVGIGRGHTNGVIRINEGAVAQRTDQLLEGRGSSHGRILGSHVGVDGIDLILHVLGKHAQVFQTSLSTFHITLNQGLTNALGMLQSRQLTINTGRTSLDSTGYDVFRLSTCLFDLCIIGSSIVKQLLEHGQIGVLLLVQLQLTLSGHLEQRIH